MAKVSKNSSVSKLEGVFARGYGVVPRAVLTAPELTPEAKVLYSYFCVASGNSGGYQRAPTEETILSHLQISHPRYLRHRRALVEQGYIHFAQKRKRAGEGRQIFCENTFIIAKDVFSFSSFSDHSLPEVAALQEGVYSDGYGLVPRVVLCDAELSIVAKAAYVYLCVVAQARTSTDRIATVISADLYSFVPKNRMQKAISQLIDAGYVRRERVGTGRFSGNTYILNLYPMKPSSQIIPAGDESPEPYFVTTEIEGVDPSFPLFPPEILACNGQIKERSLSPSPEPHFVTTEHASPEPHFVTAENDLPGPRFVTTENSQNVTAIYINKNFINKHTKSVCPSYADTSHKDGLTDARASENIQFFRDAAAGQIEAHILAQEYGEDILQAVVNIMADVYAARTGTVRINGRPYAICDVAKAFRALKAVHVEHVLDTLNNQGVDRIKNFQAYLVACLYNAPITLGGQDIAFRAGTPWTPTR